MKVSTIKLIGDPSKFEILNDSTMAVFCDAKTSKVGVDKTSKLVVDEKSSFPGRLRQISRFDESSFVSIDEDGKIRLAASFS